MLLLLNFFVALSTSSTDGGSTSSSFWFWFVPPGTISYSSRPFFPSSTVLKCSLHLLGKRKCIILKTLKNKGKNYKLIAVSDVRLQKKKEKTLSLAKDSFFQR
ncbi:hypothetical protein TNCT_361241 [Trichonephila clavata]|uniref:Secreted protein n=1 Tax=Trichonephila clavata TaxID=2740835 RepID=A0A8X6EZP5_TRICU|nr:hypothetical protein TNCT_361241 [Trichonephila clavata]